MVGHIELEDYKQIFVDRSHLLEHTAFDRLVDLSQKTNQSLEQLLMEKAFISPNQFLQLASEHFNVPQTSLKTSELETTALQFLKQDEALSSLAFPFYADHHSIKLAVVNPRNSEVIEKLINPNQLDVSLYVTTEQALRRAIISYDPEIKDILDKASEDESGEDANVAAALALSIIETAVILEASDIHLEPYEDTALVRLRIDGLLKQMATINTNLYTPLATNFKVKSGLRIDQTRVPQDGRFTLNLKGQEVNVRISTVPSLWGEKIVMRVLLKDAHMYDLNNLGFLDSDLELIKKNLKRPFGMILVSGPTGSGKTTTLYSYLQEIGSERINVVNISTIEDPIEYTIPRVTQIQTQPDIDLTFSSGLRALLRQDPDIIMVGEIRDEETADIAVRAALVGRMLLSTIHTNDAVGVIPRLLDMNVEPFLISSTLVMVVAQRLARKLCTYCRQSYEIDQDTRELLNKSHDIESALKTLQRVGVLSEADPSHLRFFKAVGCDKCDHTGYIGRVGLYEILELTDTIRTEIINHKNASTLKKMAKENGMKTMFEDGLAKVTMGIIDISELLRVVYE